MRKFNLLPSLKNTIVLVTHCSLLKKTLDFPWCWYFLQLRFSPIFIKFTPKTHIEWTLEQTFLSRLMWWTFLNRKIFWINMVCVILWDKTFQIFRNEFGEWFLFSFEKYWFFNLQVMLVQCHELIRIFRLTVCSEGVWP